MSRSESTLKLKVITPEKMLIDEDVDEVYLPGLDGDLGILPGHRSLLAAVGIGELSYIQAGKDASVAVSGGYAEVSPYRVLVFTKQEEKKNEGQE